MTGNEVIILAYNKGYRVDEHGNLLSPSGKIRKTRKDSHGYYETNVRIEGKLYHLQLHRLFAYQKFGDKLFESECVRHIDGNPLNNSFDNIEIGTLSENSMDIPKDVRTKRALIATSYVRKYNKEEVKKFYINNGCSYKKTMSKFGISSKGTLGYILRN